MPRTQTIAGIAGLCAIALAATAAPLPTAVASPTAGDRPVELLEAAPTTAKADALGGERSRAVELDSAALADTRAGDRITLALFEDTSITAQVEDRSTFGGITTWIGGIEGEDGSFTAVETAGATHINVASVLHGTYEVRSTRAGDYVVVEAGDPPAGGDDTVGPGLGKGHEGHEGHEGRTATERRSSGAAADAVGDGITAEADAPSTIDVAIVYPAALVAQLGEAPMQAQFATGIAQTNEALTASGISTQLRLVGTRQVAAAQSSTLTANINLLRTPGDGVFDEAQALREETHADLVSLWLAGSVPPGSSCGIGSLGGTSPEYDPSQSAWTVLYADRCATEFRVFAHEIGHNLSAHHDAGAAQPPTDGKPYARGYVDVPAQTITVMSYYDQCRAASVDCTRIGYFSNPNVVATNGRVQGTAAANNAQAIAEQVGAVASYRQSQIYPGAVSIAGRARWKGTVTASTTPWSPAVALGYQWFLDGAPVAGATGNAYKLTRKDIGKTLTLQVVGSAPYYPAVATTTGPVVVGKAQFRTKRPKLRGVPRAGRVLSVSVKGWKPKPAKKSVKVRYQWLKNGKKIKGAKKATYRVRAKDRGKKISVKVTVKAKGYEKTRRSSKKVKIRR